MGPEVATLAKHGSEYTVTVQDHPAKIKTDPPYYTVSVTTMASTWADIAGKRTPQLAWASTTFGYSIACEKENGRWKLGFNDAKFQVKTGYNPVGPRLASCVSAHYNQ